MKKFNLMQVLPELKSGGVEQGTIDVANYIADYDIKNLIVSNGGNKTYAYEYSKFISIKPPKVKIINENGAGDVMAGNYIYYRSKNYTLEKSLSLGIATGIMHVKSKKNIKINFKSIKKISNQIKINKEKII